MSAEASNLKVRPGASYQEILARDPRGVPDILAEHTRDFGTGPILASRYTSRAFFEKEIEKVWLKTWQYVCREEHIPEPGDTHVYDLLDKRVIVVRQRDRSLKAMQNVCLHRGRQLVTTNGCRAILRCPYHGLAWNIDGSFAKNPFEWDFPQIDERDFALPGIRLETWAGFVFINFDDQASPLLEQLAPMPEHFARWRIEDCTMVAHVGKVCHANWKAVAEAFLEAHHIITTHPQINAINCYEAGQYDVLSDHVSRFLNPSGLTSTAFSTSVDEADRIRFLQQSPAQFGTIVEPFEPEPGMTARNYAGEISRRWLTASVGPDFEDTCDAELMDGMSYDFFPNFHLWGGFRDKICYRFRPHGMDHEKTLMEVMLFRIAANDGPKPPPAPFHMLGEDEPWTAASELGFLSGVYDQDQSNLAPVQEGLRAMGENGVLRFSKYLETRCRHLHHMIDEYMAR